MKIRIATSADIAGVIELQSKYIITNIPESERANGFVTTPFTVDQIERAIELEGLFVAEDKGEIVAYVFAASWEFFSQWSIFPYMVSRLKDLNFRNAEITAENSFQYGPVCIDARYRGAGLLTQLFELMRVTMSKKFPIGVTFINKVNTRSFDAHTRKVNLEVIDEFSFNNNNYYGLAFFTNEREL